MSKGESFHTGDGGFVTVKDSGDRADVYVGDRGSSDHCHGWADARTGSQGVVHRGGCDECRGSDDSGK